MSCPINEHLNIIIVGAGLAGCCAAIPLAKNGHSVLVLEQRGSLSPKGGAIMIRPGAAKVLISWGLHDAFTKIADENASTVVRSLQTGQVVLRNIAIDISEYPDWCTSRHVAQELLYNEAVGVGAQFQFNTVVHDVGDTPDGAWVRLGGGQILEADLIIAADGIRSRLRSKILHDYQGPIEPTITKETAYSMRLAFENLRMDSEARELLGLPELTIWAGKGAYVVGRRLQKLQAYDCLFIYEDENTNQRGLWDEDGDIDYVRQAFAGCAPMLQGLLKLAETCDRWKFAALPDITRWTSNCGRTILLGDSAHAMLPNAAQGFSQIIEDIGALEYLVETLDKSGVPEATRWWQDLRVPRALRIKAFAFWNTEVFSGRQEPRSARRQQHSSNPDTSMGNIKSLKTIRANPNAPFTSAEFLKWAHDYDVVAAAQKYASNMKAKI